MPFFTFGFEEELNCNLSFVDEPEKANCWTHGGNFHADETFVNVFMGKYLEDAIVFRCPQKLPGDDKKGANTIVYDTGMGKFDHHQPGGNGHHKQPNNETKLKPIEYASLGLIWEKFGRDYCNRIAKSYGDMKLSEYLWKWVENKLILPIDAADNGTYPRTDHSYENYRVLTISNALTLYNPNPSEGQDYAYPLCQASSLANLVFDTVIKEGVWTYENIGKKDAFVCKSSPKFYTHEVFSEIILKKMFPNSSNEELDTYKNCYEDEVCYHPLKGNSLYEKIPMPTSSFGVLWERAGKDYVKNMTNNLSDSELNYVWNFVKDELVIGIDAHANGIKPLNDPEYVSYNILTLSDFIDALNPLEFSEDDFKFAKETALRIADSIFERVLKKALDRIMTRDYIEEKINSSTGHLLILDKFVHWQEWVSRSTNPEAKNLWFVIFPSNKGIYNIQPIPCRYNQNGFRKGFPRKWYGYTEEELRKITKVSDASFVHPKGFIGGAETLEGAKEMAQKAFCHNENARLPRW